MSDKTQLGLVKHLLDHLVDLSHSKDPCIQGQTWRHESANAHGVLPCKAPNFLVKGESDEPFFVNEDTIDEA